MCLLPIHSRPENWLVTGILASPSSGRLDRSYEPGSIRSISHNFANSRPIYGTMTVAIRTNRVPTIRFPGSPLQCGGPLAPIPEDASCDWSQMPSSSKISKKELSKVYTSSLINQERAKHCLPPMKRSATLEKLAMIQAKNMADRCRVEHSANDVSELQEMLSSAIVGENVQSGASVNAMMETQSQVLRDNVLGDFTHFGVGTAKGADGKIYLCQLFKTV